MNNTSDNMAEFQSITTSTQWPNDALSLEKQAGVFLWKVWPPCLLLLGGFGNIATIFVMRRIKDNNSSQHVILMALAVSDFSLLYTSLLRQWLYHLFHVDVYDLHIVVCKLSTWLPSATSTTSSWLLTCVTVQRTMAVKWPHKMRMMCSLQRTWVVVAAVVTFGCALHLHLVFGMVMSDDNRCTFRSVGYTVFIMHVWTWVDLTVFTLLPSLCLLFCDAILSSTLFKAASSTSKTMSTITNSNTLHIISSRRRTASWTTIMILALSSTFLVLTMPVCIYTIWAEYVYTSSTQNTKLINRRSVEVAVFTLLWFTNSAINFLLYCFTGTRFRKEFLKWICCGARVRPNLSVGDSHFGISTGRKDKQF